MTRVVIAGGHGKIALVLERLLSQRGDSVAGFVRNPAHAADLQAAGAEALVVDLENASVDEVAAHLRGADAVVFAAGAGPGSGAARKETVDRDAAILLADAAETAKVTRYVMISSIGADAEAADDAGDPVFVAYLRAKGAADDNVRARKALDSTIVRPGHLTNDPGTGRVTIGDDTGRGDIPREDVAAVLLAVLDSPATVGQTFEVISGGTPITDAVTTSASD
jgi:uncharacterized protein YbjT (DUF2867 family)